MFRKFTSVCILISFLATSVVTPDVSAQRALSLPVPGTLVPLSEAFHPPILKGMTVYPDNPFQFDFMIDAGEDNLTGQALEDESQKLIKYFLASLTTPEKEMWVNLAPHEENRIIPTTFGQTVMGRDVLAQDYILKQLTASLMSPDEELGRAFWDQIYQKVKERYGTTDMMIDTYHKIWIVPESSRVHVNGNPSTGSGQAHVFVVDSKLRVMMEEDYEAMIHGSQEHKNTRAQEDISCDVSLVTCDHNPQVSSEKLIATQVMREVLLPAIEHEVNHGKTFANLRQVFNSMILATWYKQNLRDTIIAKGYVNQGKIDGFILKDKNEPQHIYDRYMQAFEKGVYNYIKEEYDPASQQVLPRQYFSGGVDAAMLPSTVMQTPVRHLSSAGMLNMATVKLLTEAPSAAMSNRGSAGYLSNLERTKKFMDKIIGQIKDYQVDIPKIVERMNSNGIKAEDALREVFRDSIAYHDNIANISFEQRLSIIERFMDAGLFHIEPLASEHSTKRLVLDNLEEVGQWIREQQVQRTGLVVSHLVYTQDGARKAIKLNPDIDQISVNFLFSSDQRNQNKATNKTRFEGIQKPILSYLSQVNQSERQGRPIKIIASFSNAWGVQEKGDVNLQMVLKWARIFKENGADGILLGDNPAFANPNSMREMIKLIHEDMPDMEIHLHLHDDGVGIATALAAIEMGVNVLESSIGNLGRAFFKKRGEKVYYPGNLSTEDFLFLMQALGIRSDVDLDQLNTLVSDTAEMLEDDFVENRRSLGIYQLSSIKREELSKYIRFKLGLSNKLPEKGDSYSSGYRPGSAAMTHDNAQTSSNLVTLIVPQERRMIVKEILHADEVLNEYYVEETPEFGPVTNAGGFSVVHRQRANSRKFIKRVHEEYLQEYFFNELKIIAELNKRGLKHIPVLRRIGFGQNDMWAEFEGISAGFNLEHPNTSFDLILDEGLEIIIGVANIMHEIHSLGLLHNDLTPDNILVNRYKQWMIIDFGISNMVGKDIGSAGTENYRLYEGENYIPDEMSDIYALGGTLRHLLNQLRKHRYDRLWEHVKGSGLEYFIDQTRKQSKSARQPKTMKEFAERLEIIRQRILASDFELHTYSDWAMNSQGAKPEVKVDENMNAAMISKASQWFQHFPKKDDLISILDLENFYLLEAAAMAAKGEGDLRPIRRESMYDQRKGPPKPKTNKKGELILPNDEFIQNIMNKGEGKIREPSGAIPESLLKKPNWDSVAERARFLGQLSDKEKLRQASDEEFRRLHTLEAWDTIIEKSKELGVIRNKDQNWKRAYPGDIIFEALVESQKGNYEEMVGVSGFHKSTMQTWAKKYNDSKGRKFSIRAKELRDENKRSRKNSDASSAMTSKEDDFSENAAMGAVRDQRSEFRGQFEENPGGIDFDPALMEMEVTEAKTPVSGKVLGGKEVNVPTLISPGDIKALYPVILNIAPVTNLPLLLGVADEPTEDERQADRIPEKYFREAELSKARLPEVSLK